MGLSVGCGGVGLSAQDEPKPQDEPIHTLHVYANLLQVPTLVLGRNRERLKTPIAESRFSVSIDSGPWYRVTHVRPEGDDPISLAILLDPSGDAAELMPKIDDAIAALAPLSLHPKDHVSIFGLDCTLVGSLNDAPADSLRLKTAVERALGPWTIRQQNKHEPECRASLHLWDVLAFISRELGKLPGRRVILAVSQGDDKGSVHPWNEVRFYAQTMGVAVFGLSYIPQSPRATGRAYTQRNTEDPFRSLCELSGGIVMRADRGSLEDALKDFVTKVRERYIVEFPRPTKSLPGGHAEMLPGEHGMEVKIAKGSYFIRPAGISVPIPDAALLADPTTVPSDPSLTPQPGTRKPLTQPQ
ncbi:MAG TPA: hypothetical protein VH117_03490 [Edaphobacter sp.]|nr:hypothetical protein [Edaphobacter sp.]